MAEYIVEKKQTSGGWTWAEPKGKLIRCKDCKWYEMGEEETFCRELGIFNTDPTSYCSYAKRKEE